MTGVTLLVLVALPAVAAMAGSIRRLRSLAPALGAGAALVATALAGTLAVTVVVGGPVAMVLANPDGRAWTGLVVDHVGAIVLLLVCTVSAVVQAFARRYLHGDPAAARFAVAAGALTAATTVMVTAATLVTLAVAWTLTGVILCRLVGMYRPAPSAVDAARRTTRAVVAGDAALWTGVVLAVTVWGDLDLRHQGDAALGGAVGTVVACSLVVAAAVRCAQLPWHRWLPATLAAPTPVSALLHAGVVNAGGVLLVKLSPIVGAAPVATHLAFAIGAASVVAATAIMLTRPDIKGALVHSTIGQMGFMLMTCGLGLYAATVVHLVAHGLFKATLFLGSGSAVQRHAGHTAAPPAPRLAPARAAQVAVLAGVAAVAAVGVAAWLLPLHAGGVALSLFAVATAARLAWGWLRRHPTGGALVTVVIVLPGVAIGYLALVGAVTELLAPSLPASGPAAVSAWVLATVVAVLAAGALLLHLAPAVGLGRWRDRLYVAALSAGQQRTYTAAWGHPPRLVPTPRPRPVPQLEGARA
ncbi:MULTISPECIES: proton-conducting transporter membrane subunit [Pseudonocardiaceae]|uniref:NADH:ubiquinone oxidoreductase subunit 5 (Chain L)/multisubunit Na+/H+ antiporter, MnhA subunit n=2 Tax=Pseudonocardiaceae TaxID=2070 RepID=H5XFZ3_9PSEU|nr:MULTISPECIES: proton-conducting transporter membrane subunit [Pseudonocardiaceae]EHR61549.1 NADH:ubiquinone oxidoreductase subunit 5 (chain L)/multisubunit Na+/H+ antiporter, MnhA subunit [Saccharomonospora cyanea NA-134]MBP2371315.1 NADH:ubiquinone oxidoreductase subunit 5 (subunit L)/multisubunit Na+/H+ antiporter MnhA subunit [Pseudonocardia parietis]